MQGDSHGSLILPERATNDKILCNWRACANTDCNTRVKVDIVSPFGSVPDYLQ